MIKQNELIKILSNIYDIILASRSIIKYYFYQWHNSSWIIKNRISQKNHRFLQILTKTRIYLN